MQHLGAVVTCAGAMLLLWAGGPRLLAHGDRRRQLAGLGESVIAAAVLLAPAHAAAALLTLTFGLFSVLHLRDLALGGEVCECFGQDEQVPPARGAALTGGLALLAAGAAAVGAPSLGELAGRDGASLAWTPTAALVLAVAWRIGFSGAGALGRVSDASGTLLERGARRGGAHSAAADLLGPEIERRSFLLRVAVFGSALAAAPVRFLLYPGSALGAVVRPWDCREGKCLDGYTGFCCEINQGGANQCPTGTFPGGWWMCTDYAGRQLCSDQGVRYYVDCNSLPGVPFPGGCRCGNDSCANRKIACNVFRYGQCNTQIEGTTAVVCRLVTCENPATVSALHCSAALAVDDSTCAHEAGCLEPPALQLAGAGGA